VGSLALLGMTISPGSTVLIFWVGTDRWAILRARRAPPTKFLEKSSRGIVVSNV
jgi:hypothetical protein